jgi:tetratricopeptide (TPR) repeat protein
VSKDDTTSRPEPRQRRPSTGPRRRLGIEGGATPVADDHSADVALYLAEASDRDAAGNYEAAVAACRRALEIDPSSIEGWNSLGNAWVHLDRSYDAIAAYERAIEIREDVYECWFNLGTAQADVKDYDEAVRCLDRALALKPNAYDVWYNLGFAYERRGDLRASLWLEDLRFRSPSGAGDCGGVEPEARTAAHSAPTAAPTCPVRGR